MFSVLGLDATSSELLVLLFLAAFAVLAGFFGGLLGLGGGLFVVPMLVLLFRVPIAVAVATSLVAVIATSSGSASSALGRGLADLRLGMFLETATVVGGLVGALLTVAVLAGDQQFLDFAFVPTVLAPAYLTLRRPREDTRRDAPPDPLARRLRLSGSYFDEPTGRTVDYEVTGTPLGLLSSGLAGFVSGLLGIGGGLFYVPAMNSLMNVPIRVASATSTFMIGVTATASALVYLLAGEVALFWTAPLVVGILLGSRLGADAHRTIPVVALKRLFVGALIVAAALMALRGAGVV